MEWINQNSGGILAILTLVYTAATMILVIMNQKTIREMQLTRKHQMLPFVSISFDIIRRGLCCLIIKNHGNSVAKAITVNFTDECLERLKLVVDEDDMVLSNLSKGHMVLAPGQTQYFCICGMVGNFDKLAAGPIEGQLTYLNIFNEITREDFAIYTNAYEGALLYGNDIDELTYSIKNLEKSIKESLNTISGSMKKSKV